MSSKKLNMSSRGGKLKNKLHKQDKKENRKFSVV